MERLTAIRPDGGDGASTSILAGVDPTIAGSPEAFVIDIEPRVITVNGRTPDGMFQGLTTLAKAIGAGSAETIEIPAATITGDPAFRWRGAHFDVCRHFYGMDQVKKFIDMMALHGLNTFHWHLNDDQGWRIEIKKYPLLTEIGSHRDSTTILRNSGKWDHTPVDGYFTQDQAREIVRYAADRHITVVPEIDFPGHMRAALTAYPELGCTGGPYSVWTEWGVTTDVLCPGKKESLPFIADVLNEIMDIFPSEVIHIGGDECPKHEWEKCPDCQALIKRMGIKAKNGYTAEQMLQAYVTKFAYDVCSRRGRRIIGWDEILQGEIPQDAIVMSWRAWTGTEGASEAIDRGNDVVLTPNSCLYFDFYQTKDTQMEPFAIGGFTPVEKVYNFDPYSVADGKTEGSERHILGVQANLWTEYIPTFDHVQYMELPRMAALSEIQWGKRGEKDYADFLRRIPAMLAIYDRLGWNYARHIADAAATFTPSHADKSLTVALSSLADAEIRYTFDGSAPTAESPLYESPLKISDDRIITYASFRGGRRGRVLSDTIMVNDASFRSATLNSTPAPGYASGGANTLVDGIRGTYNYRTGRWVGHHATPLDITVDLGSPTQVHSIGFNVAVFACDGVVDASKAEVLLSDDGRTFTPATEWIGGEISQDDEFTVKHHTIALREPRTARYVRLKVHPQYSLPQWHNLAGSPGFVFVDEIAVN